MELGRLGWYFPKTYAHKDSLKLIFMCTKLFGMFNYLHDYDSQAIEGVLVQNNFKVTQVDPWVHPIVISFGPQWRVGIERSINMQNPQLVP